MCGTPGYIAPEILHKSECGVKADVFSAGVVFYFLLSGLHPFEGETADATLEANARAQPEYTRACFKACSFDVMLLLRCMLTVSLAQRCSSSSAVRAVARFIGSHSIVAGRDEASRKVPSAAADAPTVQGRLTSIGQHSMHATSSVQGLVRQLSAPVEADDIDDDNDQGDYGEEFKYTRSEPARPHGHASFLLGAGASMHEQHTCDSGDDDSDRGDDGGEFKHAHWEPAKTHGHARFNVAMDEQHTSSGARNLKGFLSKYRRKFSFKYRDDRATALAHPDLHSPTSNNTSMESSFSVTSYSRFPSFLRRGSRCQDEVIDSPSESSTCHSPSSVLNLGRSAWRAVRKPFKRDTADVQYMLSDANASAPLESDDSWSHHESSPVPRCHETKEAWLEVVP
eukprot:TRINITY_DN7974_c1_g2_i2.p1 TRINITY_DN7974_c1_g2~~TRINITY_DN7974_c1_g2_i2.p1  ORF type:complete len:446 (-),score=35.11 TRINITY_DN7974_c1_g2_i2:150-1340(-)